MGQVEIENLSRSYVVGGQVQEVLKDSNLTIMSGSFCALSGPSGSGKSTVLNLIGALDSPDNGRILIDGNELGNLTDNELADFRAHHIGFIFQAFHLIPVLTAAENVAWPLYFRGIPAKERIQKAKDVLEQVGLLDFANRLPKHLSGGQQQRVAIARALVGQPSVILADEPTANLDRKTSEEIMGLLKQLNQTHSMTLIAATHDPLVIDMANQQLQISDYKISMKN